MDKKRVATMQKRTVFYTTVLSGLFVVFLSGALLAGGNWSSQQRRTLIQKIGLPAPRHGGIYVVAHRGYHKGIPENTLPAYRKAAEIGVDFVEIDVRTTRDGHLVSCHNATIDKYVPGKTGRIHDLTLAELEKIDVGKRMGPQWANTPIPTLEQIFQTVQGRCGIYFDLKETPIRKLIKMVHRYKMEKQVLWYSPFVRVNMFRKLRELCPACLPLPDPGPSWLLPVLLKIEHPPVVASTYDNCSRNFAEKCHAAGVLVIVDEDKGGPQEWQKMVQWGVDGIQTDEPEGLMGFLEKNVVQ